MPVDQSVIGKATGRFRVAIDRSPVTNFARAVKDDSPAYADPAAARAAGFSDIPVPPTYSFAMQHWGQFPELQAGLEPVEGNPMFEVIGKLQAKGGLVLHGEQEFTYHRPLVVGDVLRGEGRVVDAYEKESSNAVMTFVVSETVWRDDRSGEPVVTTKFNLIHRAAKS